MIFYGSRNIKNVACVNVIVFHSYIVYSCRHLLLYVNEYCIFPSVECWILNIFSVKTC
jgi:hypothetical protein